MLPPPFDMLWPQAAEGRHKALARCITLVENRVAGSEALLRQLQPRQVPVVGITGPPGAGKSTLVDALIGHWVDAGKRVAVLCVDPSSPFNLGALLGDRIRMSRWYTHPSVFIRSLATRGSLGGLHPYIIEITDLLQASPFDVVVVETVGVGQSEIEIAGLADSTVVVVVPEAGDEVQTMKAGLMEIADIFVVNKSDRPGADQFVRNLRLMLAPAFHQAGHEVDIVSTVASRGEGIGELAAAVERQLHHPRQSDRRAWLLAEKAWHLIQAHRMRDIDRRQLRDRIHFQLQSAGKPFNIYRFAESYFGGVPDEESA